MDVKILQNPLIGDTDGDTIENVKELVAFLCRSCEVENEQGRGLQLSLQSVMCALRTVKIE